jgi:hypothetical protein
LLDLVKINLPFPTVAPEFKIPSNPPTESPAVPSLNEYLCVRYEPVNVVGFIVGCKVGENVGAEG